MTPIIAGRFEQNDRAEAAAEALRRAGRFDAHDVSVFFVNPPGQHATFPIGGDRDVSPGAKHAEGGALKGAALGGAVGAGVGLAATPLLGPAALLAGAGAGAYAGSLVGALGDMKGTADTEPAEEGGDTVVVATSPGTGSPVREGGVLVAVRAVDFAKRVDAVNILRSAGAQDIERGDGTWEAGHWIDFDPLKPPLLVDLPPSGGVSVRR